MGEGMGGGAPKFLRMYGKCRFVIERYGRDMRAEGHVYVCMCYFM